MENPKGIAQTVLRTKPEDPGAVTWQHYDNTLVLLLQIKNIYMNLIHIFNLKKLHSDSRPFL